MQIGLIGDDLPVRMLHPLPDNLFVGQLERMLQILQPCDQARRCRRATLA